MPTKKSQAVAPLLLIVSLALAVTAVPVNGQSGAWKLRGKGNSSEWASAAQTLGSTVVVLADEKGVKYKWEGIDANRKPVVFQFEAKFDGKEYPVTGKADGYFVSVKRIDANTIESVWKKDGQVILEEVSRVSKDGKTRTSTLWGGHSHGWDGDPHGQSKEIELVYDKMDIACGPKFCEKQCKGKCGNGASCDCPKK
jgi:hypothetical protein